MVNFTVIGLSLAIPLSSTVLAPAGLKVYFPGKTYDNDV